MKTARVITLLIVVFGMALSTYAVSEAGSKTQAEELIHAFMKEKGITIEKDTKQYLQFMKDILLGEYPELTGEGSKYVSDQKELDLILEYATEQTSPLFKDFPKEPDTQEVIPELDSLENVDQAGGMLLSTYNRTNAINYAYAWWNG